MSPLRREAAERARAVVAAETAHFDGAVPRDREACFRVEDVRVLLDELDSREPPPSGEPISDAKFRAVERALLAREVGFGLRGNNGASVLRAATAVVSDVRAEGYEVTTAEVLAVWLDGSAAT